LKNGVDCARNSARIHSAMPYIVGDKKQIIDLFIDRIKVFYTIRNLRLEQIMVSLSQGREICLPQFQQRLGEAQRQRRSHLDFNSFSRASACNAVSPFRHNFLP
jgi:hypothetical protein